jgi:hypothetical protein
MLLINSRYQYLLCLELYQIMSNVYLTWESALIIQLNAENPEFFQMFFRHYKSRNIKKILGT